MRGRTATILLLVGLPGLLAGCATRDWVRENLTRQNAENDRRFTAVETRVTEDVGRVEQRVEGMGFRVQKVEGAVEEVGGIARGAREQADAAAAKAQAVDERLTRLWSKRHMRNAVDVVDVKFGFNRADLDDGAQTALLNVIRELQANPNLTVDLAGYADPQGAREYNVALSQRRVEAVRRFLVDKGIELPRINSIGLGPIDDRGVPNAQKRRVTVKLMLHVE